MGPSRAAPALPTFSATVDALRSAQKSAKGAPAYSRFVNRRAGRYLAAAAYRLGRTPNQVTAVSALCTFAGIAALAVLRPSVPLGLLVCLALVLGYALDAADGQLARLRGGGTVAGEWLDHVVDSAKIPALHLSVLVSAYRFGELGAGWLLVPIGFCLVATVLFFATILNDQLRRASRTAPDRGRPSTVRSILVVPTDYGLLCLAFATLGVTPLFATIYGLLFAANALFLAAAAVKWYGEMGRLDR